MNTWNVNMYRTFLPVVERMESHSTNVVSTPNMNMKMK